MDTVFISTCSWHSLLWIYTRACSFQGLAPDRRGTVSHRFSLTFPDCVTDIAFWPSRWRPLIIYSFINTYLWSALLEEWQWKHDFFHLNLLKAVLKHAADQTRAARGMPCTQLAIPAPCRIECGTRLHPLCGNRCLKQESIRARASATVKWHLTRNTDVETWILLSSYNMDTCKWRCQENKHSGAAGYL